MYMYGCLPCTFVDLRVGRFTANASLLCHYEGVSGGRVRSLITSVTKWIYMAKCVTVTDLPPLREFQSVGVCNLNIADLLTSWKFS